MVSACLHFSDTPPLYSQENEEPPQLGNFALSTSQQPSGLFALFGANIIDKGEVQLYFFADYFKGRERVISDLLPNAVIGITNDFSVQINLPFTPLMQDGNTKSRGIEDFFIQLEYAFYNKSTSTYADQATVVFNTTAPTGSVRKRPPTGLGSPAFFLGGTFYHTTVDWLLFTAQGILLTTSHRDTKIGEIFLSQFGVEEIFPVRKDGFMHGCSKSTVNSTEEINREFSRCKF